MAKKSKEEKKPEKKTPQPPEPEPHIDRTGANHYVLGRRHRTP